MAFLTIKSRYISSWGGLSLAALQIALISGLFLIPLFEPGHEAFASYTVLFNHTFSNLLQAIHHRSSDLFLITLGLHIWEYLNDRAYKGYSRKRWYFLVLLLFFSFAVAFSGFLSIGNEEGLSAGRILKTLLDDLPGIGSILHLFFLEGVKRQGGTVYYHHIATFTVLTLVLTYIHIRRMQAENRDMIIAFAFILIWAVLFPGKPGFPPDSPAPVIWGPWYFMGLQQLLKIFPPFTVIAIYPVIVLLFFALLPEKRGRFLSQIFGGLIILYFLFGIWAFFALIPG